MGEKEEEEESRGAQLGARGSGADLERLIDDRKKSVIRGGGGGKQKWRVVVVFLILLLVEDILDLIERNSKPDTPNVWRGWKETIGER